MFKSPLIKIKIFRSSLLELQCVQRERPIQRSSLSSPSIRRRINSILSVKSFISRLLTGRSLDARRGGVLLLFSFTNKQQRRIGCCLRVLLASTPTLCSHRLEKESSYPISPVVTAPPASSHQVDTISLRVVDGRCAPCSVACL